MASRTFMHVVALLAPLFAGDAMLPFSRRPLESSSYLLNKAMRPDALHVPTAAGWLDHFLQTVEGGAPVPEGPALSEWLADAVRWAAAAIDDPQAAIDNRLYAMDVLQAADAMLDSDNKLLAASMPESVRTVGGKMRVATVAALCVAAGYPDTGLAANLHQGFPIVGDIPACGIYPPKEQPATVCMDDLDHARWFHAEVARSYAQWRTASPAVRAGITAIAESTDDAVLKGLAIGPFFTQEEMDERHPEGWRCMIRFPVPQNGDYRGCDDAKRSRHNDATSTHDTIRCVSGQLPAQIATAFYKEWGGARAALLGGTDDIHKAYWRVANSQPQWSIILVYSPARGAVVMYEVPGQCMGLRAAVLNFNRLPAFSMHVCQRVFRVCADHYFDDVVCVEPAYLANSGQLCLEFVQNLIGLPFAPAKHAIMAPAVVFLGALTDLSTLVKGFVTMGIKPGRSESIAVLIHGILSAGGASGGLVDTLVGKLYFLLSTALGPTCLALLQVVRDAGDFSPGSAAAAALSFLLIVTGLLPMRRIFAKDKRPPIYVWSDAFYVHHEELQEVARHESGLGLFAYDPENGKKLVAYAPTPYYFFRLFLPKAQYVGQLESLAVLAADMTIAREWRGCMRDRRVVHFVDNQSALYGMRKGYSGKPDTALLILAFWIHAALAGAMPWFEYVNTKLNIADLASRDDCAQVCDVIQDCKQVELGLPSEAMWGTSFVEWPRFLAARDRPSSQPSSGAKRAALKRRRI